MERISFPRTFAWSAVLVGAALVWFPCAARAADPVKKLKDAVVQQDFKLIESAIGELRSISELRRGYFLGDWGVHKEFEVDPKLVALRTKVGERLTLAIQSAADRAAKSKSAEHQIAVARTIAEMAESDRPTDRSEKGKFASRFVPILKSLATHDDLLIRQCAIDALGKVTPRPGDVMPILHSALKGSEIGPRRIAAYALIDLVRNANYLERGDEMDTVAEAINAAAISVGSEDELIRAYSLQTIHWSAKLFTDYPRSTDTAFFFEKDPQKPDVRKVFRALHAANPGVVSALKEGNGVDIRLTALEALSHIVSARAKIMERLAEFHEKTPADKRPMRGGLFNKGEDPLGKLLEGDWVIVPGLLKKEEDVRLRRAAMFLLETVAEDVEQAITAQKMERIKGDGTRQQFLQAVRRGLQDSDRVVRWSAARTVRYVPGNLIDASIVEGLGHMLTDPFDRDYDLSATAAATLEAIVDSPAAPRALRFLKSAIVDIEMDVEIREAALRIVGQIGADGNLAFPEVTRVLPDGNVRIRRLATETLGLLGRPTTRAHYEDAIAALKTALRDDDAQVRQNAAEAILNIEMPGFPPAPQRVLPAVKE